MVVGAYLRQVGQHVNRGTAYVFTRSGSQWLQQGAPLVSSDGAAGDWFGSNVALSGDTALIAASNKSFGVPKYQGSAYVFTRSGQVWSEQQVLQGSNVGGGAGFGRGVALEGDTALVGAPFKESIYVFTRTASKWSQQGPPITNPGVGGDTVFGTQLALSGDTFLAGGEGLVAVFTRQGGVWSQQGPLLEPDVEVEYFGASVALLGDTALIGSAGYAFSFTRRAGVWTQDGPGLVADDAQPLDGFGRDVSLAPGYAAIGGFGKGAVYLFAREGGAWKQQGKATRVPGADSYSSLAITDDALAVGNYYEQVGANIGQGATYVYDAPSLLCEPGCGGGGGGAGPTDPNLGGATSGGGGAGPDEPNVGGATTSGGGEAGAPHGSSSDGGTPATAAGGGGGEASESTPPHAGAGEPELPASRPRHDSGCGVASGRGTFGSLVWLALALAAARARRFRP